MRLELSKALSIRSSFLYFAKATKVIKTYRQKDMNKCRYAIASKKNSNASSEHDINSSLFG